MRQMSKRKSRVSERLLLITPDFLPKIGGISSYLYNIFSNFSEGVIVVAPWKENAKEFDPRQTFKIYRTPRLWGAKKLGTVSLFGLAFKTALFEDIDVVHCGHVVTGLIGLIFKKFLNRPYIVWTHALEIMQNRFSHIRCFILKNADRVITNSEFTRKRLLEIGVKPANILKVHPTVDITKFNPYVDASPIVRKYRLEKKRILLTIARLEVGQHYKGQDMVIKTLPQLLHTFPNLVYLIIGDGSDSSRLQSLAKKLNVEKSVIFAGAVSDEDIPKFYVASDLYIMASRKIRDGTGVKAEGFGIVFIEANACGKPVIGGRGCGIEDAIVDGVTGLLVNPEDTEEIRNAVVRLLSDRKLSRRFGRNGRARVLREMVPEKAVEKLKILHREINRKKDIVELRKKEE